MRTVNCPACDEHLELDDAYRDWTVRCPHCGREFVPNERGNRNRDPRDELLEEEDDEYDYLEGRNLDREQALQLVVSPGLSLEICGWGVTLLIVLGGVLVALGAMAQANNAGGNANANGDWAELTALVCCVSVFGLPYFMLMAIGGRHVRTIGSRGWALAGAILGIVSLPLFGCLGVIPAGLGIWALVTLENPIVRRAFHESGRRSRTRYRD